jgi:hypothetical protein
MTTVIHVPWGHHKLRKEVAAKPLKADGGRHSGQAERAPESSNSRHFWTPAFAGVTLGATFYDFIKVGF